MNLIDLATPGFFAAMGIEHRVLTARARAGDTSAVGYERSDTIASLLMGTASLSAPLALARAFAPLQPGRGRARAALVASALGAAAVTTAADVLAQRDDDSPITRWARRVRPPAAVTAVAAGILVGSTGWAARTSARRIWERHGSTRDLGTGIAVTAGALLVWDFIYYWNHRIQHESRWLWAIHVVHHSSEHYNLSTALRQPVADVFGMFVPYGLMAYLGFRPSVIETARALDLIYQFWIHTETIDRMGLLEEVLNTPSHHRVHHGSNRQYLDRNHAGILIIWDRMFRTFEREREKVVYGLTKNIDTFNPLRIATHEYRDMFRDVARSTNWRQRLGSVFRGPGWHRRSEDQRFTLAS